MDNTQSEFEIKLPKYIKLGLIYLLLISIMLLAMGSPKALANMLTGLYSAAAIVGVFALFRLFMSFRLKTPLSSPTSLTFSWILRIWGAQLILFIVSFAFLYTLEKSTQINPRLFPLAPGTLFLLLKAHPYQLAILPQVLFAIIGISFAYFAYYHGQTPTFARLLVSRIHDRKTFFSTIISMS